MSPLYAHAPSQLSGVTGTDSQGLVRVALAAPFLPGAVHCWGARGS